MTARAGLTRAIARTAALLEYHRLDAAVVEVGVEDHVVDAKVRSGIDRLAAAGSSQQKATCQHCEPPDHTAMHVTTAAPRNKHDVTLTNTTS
jgi:hypothetical protein